VEEAEAEVIDLTLDDDDEEAASVVIQILSSSDGNDTLKIWRTGVAIVYLADLEMIRMISHARTSKYLRLIVLGVDTNKSNW